jgi:nitrogen regulatory protein PII
MKMIWALIRSDFVQRVVGALDHAGIGAMTRLPFAGADDTNSPPICLLKTGPALELLMIAVPDHEVAKAVTIIRTHAKPEDPDRVSGDPGPDGKIFVTVIDESFTIRTSEKRAKRAP